MKNEAYVLNAFYIIWTYECNSGHNCHKGWAAPEALNWLQGEDRRGVLDSRNYSTSVEVASSDPEIQGRT